MLTLDELSQAVAAYRSGRMSLEEFENWFEDNSSGAYAVPELSEACSSVDAAFSQYYFDHIEENALKMELANAFRPSSQPTAVSTRPVQMGDIRKPFSADSASPSLVVFTRSQPLLRRRPLSAGSASRLVELTAEVA